MVTPRVRFVFVSFFMVFAVVIRTLFAVTTTVSSALAEIFCSASWPSGQFVALPSLSDEITRLPIDLFNFIAGCVRSLVVQCGSRLSARLNDLWNSIPGFEQGPHTLRSVRDDLSLEDLSRLFRLESELARLYPDYDILKDLHSDSKYDDEPFAAVRRFIDFKVERDQLNERVADRKRQAQEQSQWRLTKNANQLGSEAANDRAGTFRETLDSGTTFRIQRHPASNRYRSSYDHGSSNDQRSINDRKPSNAHESPPKPVARKAYGEMLQEIAGRRAYQAEVAATKKAMMAAAVAKAREQERLQRETAQKAEMAAAAAKAREQELLKREIAERQAKIEEKARLEREAVAEQLAIQEKARLEEEAALKEQAIREEKARLEQQAALEHQARLERQALQEQQARAEQQALLDRQAAEEQVRQEREIAAETGPWIPQYAVDNEAGPQRGEGEEMIFVLPAAGYTLDSNMDLDCPELSSEMDICQTPPVSRPGSPMRDVLMTSPVIEMDLDLPENPMANANPITNAPGIITNTMEVDTQAQGMNVAVVPQVHAATEPNTRTTRKVARPVSIKAKVSSNNISIPGLGFGMDRGGNAGLMGYNSTSMNQNQQQNFVFGPSQIQPLAFGYGQMQPQQQQQPPQSFVPGQAVAQQQQQQQQQPLQSFSSGQAVAQQQQQQQSFSFGQALAQQQKQQPPRSFSFGQAVAQQQQQMFGTTPPAWPQMPAVIDEVVLTGFTFGEQKDEDDSGMEGYDPNTPGSHHSPLPVASNHQPIPFNAQRPPRKQFPAATTQQAIRPATSNTASPFTPLRAAATRKAFQRPSLNTPSPFNQPPSATNQKASQPFTANRQSAATKSPVVTNPQAVQPVTVSPQVFTIDNQPAFGIPPEVETRTAEEQRVHEEQVGIVESFLAELEGDFEDDEHNLMQTGQGSRHSPVAATASKGKMLESSSTSMQALQTSSASLPTPPAPRPTEPVHDPLDQEQASDLEDYVSDGNDELVARSRTNTTTLVLKSGLTLSASDVTSIRGTVTAGITGTLRKRGMIAKGTGNYGLQLHDANSLDKEFKDLLANVTDSETLNDVISIFINIVHERLKKPQGKRPVIPHADHELCTADAFSDVCVEEIKLYLRTKASLRAMIA